MTRKACNKDIAWLLLTLMPVCCVGNAASADDFDTLTLRALAYETYDNNLFRRSSDTTSDRITTLGAGLRVNKEYSLQRFVVDFSAINYSYNKSSFLDFTAKNYSLGWFWSLTPSLTGSLTADRTEQLNDFSNFLATNVIQQNIRTVKNNRFTAEFSPHDTVFWTLGFTNYVVNNSQQFNQQADYTADSIDYGVGYKFASGSKLNFLAHNRSASFENRQYSIGQLFDSGYQETEYELQLLQIMTGKTAITGKFAYTAREYDNFTARNYGAYNGYVYFNWNMTGSMRLSTGLARAVYPFETAFSTYSQTDSVNADLIYDVSSKIQAKLNGKYSVRDFLGRGQFDTYNRQDDEYLLGASLSWAPVKLVSFGLSATRTRRNSTINFFDYNDTLLRATVDFTF